MRNSSKKKLDKAKDKETEKSQIDHGNHSVVPSVPALKADPTLASPLGLIGPTEWMRIDLANRAFRRYAELQHSLSHTRCCKLRLSYRGKWVG